MNCCIHRFIVESASCSNVLAKRLREIGRNRTIYKLNIIKTDDDQKKQRATERVINEGEVSVADWGAYRLQALDPLIDDTGEDYPITVSEDKFADIYRGEFDGGIDWDLFRDVLHEARYESKYDTKVKAGNAVHTVRRFCLEADEKDVVVLNTAEGKAFGEFDGPALYDPTLAGGLLPEDHVFRRKIQFARDEEGEVITIPSDDLPDFLKSNRQTMVQFDTDNLKELVRTSEALEALSKTDTISE